MKIEQPLNVLFSQLLTAFQYDIEARIDTLDDDYPDVEIRERFDTILANTQMLKEALLGTPMDEISEMLQELYLELDKNKTMTFAALEALCAGKS